MAFEPGSRMTFGRAPTVGWRVGPSLEEMTRAAAERAQLRLEARLAIRPGAGDAEAVICAGGPSRFSILEPPPGEQKTEPRVTTNWPSPCETLSGIDDALSGEECDPEETPVTLYTEVGRIEEKVRIENPDDADQYVIVARITSIQFSGPEGNILQFDYRHPDVGEVVS